MRLLPANGEVARSFGAKMYLMWIPQVLSINSTSCPNGNSCTIPVPLGSFDWFWSGDGINTLQPQSNQGVVFPLWLKNTAVDGNLGFVESSTFPTWSTTFTNQQLHTICPWL